jgi:large subunit ribosomal protein L31
MQARNLFFCSAGFCAPKFSEALLFISAGRIFAAQSFEQMKEGLHPEYRDVIFKDISADVAFKTRSTIKTKDTIVWDDGKEYPLVKLEISSASHPFFTGKQKMVDTTGRVDRFYNRYGDKFKRPS